MSQAGGRDPMLAIENDTRFTADVFSFLDSHAREHLTLVVTASFESRPGQDVRFADVPLDIAPVDRHRGDPATSSVHYPGQAAYFKPHVDVIVTGHAYSRERPVDQMTVEIRAADIHKRLLVSGDRFWRRGPAGLVPSSPKPFERVPIIYERAFGGGANPDNAAALGSAFESRNPVGIGLPGATPTDPIVTTEVPNIEYVSDQIVSRNNGRLRPVWVRFLPDGSRASALPGRTTPHG